MTSSYQKQISDSELIEKNEVKKVGMCNCIFEFFSFKIIQLFFLRKFV